MLKNNKILKAQAGAAIAVAESLPYVIPAVVAALGLSQANKDKKYGSFTPSTELEINMPTSLAEQTWPHIKSHISNIPNNVSSTFGNVYSAVSSIPNNVSSAIPYRRSLFTYTLPKTPAELRAREIAEKQQYWNDKAAFYKQELAKGPMLLPNGNVITAYNPDTRTLSGYKDSANGDRIFLDKNLQTGIYSNPVYKDAKTGAYYEGTLDLNRTIPIVGRGENLMPYSIVPVENPEWMTESPTVRIQDIPVVFNTDYFGKDGVEEDSQRSAQETPNRKKIRPKHNDDENPNQIVTAEEFANLHPEKLNRWTRWRLRNAEKISYNKNTGNINKGATKYINRGKTSTNTSQTGSSWGTKLGWFLAGAGAGGGAYAIFSSQKNTPEEKPTLDGNIETVVNEAINATSAPNNLSNSNQSNTEYYNYDDLDF